MLTHCAFDFERFARDVVVSVIGLASFDCT